MASASAGRSLSGIDLNLLRALDALLAEAHVTRAARRVGLSQSAMSHALTRLRGLLGDALLVRTGRGMSLTARARGIAAPLSAALGSLEAALGAGGPFDPSGVEREFRIAAIDFAQLVLIPPLVTALAREAPGVTLVVLPPVEAVERALADGSIDLALGLARDAPGMQQRDLCTERFVCLVRKRHPAVGRKLTIKRFAGLPHVMVSFRGRVQGAVDPALRRRGVARRMVLTVPHMLAAALVIARSDCVLTVSERVARLALVGLPLRVLEPPVELPPFRVDMLWHPRQDADPAHGFLRDRLAAIARHV